jgi:hypothetical protein
MKVLYLNYPSPFVKIVVIGQKFGGRKKRRHKEGLKKKLPNCGIKRIITSKTFLTLNLVLLFFILISNNVSTT